MNRHCKFVISRLSQYVDGELGSGDRARIEEHIRGCASCAQALKETGRETHLLRASLNPFRLDSQLSDQVLGRLPQEERAPQMTPRPAYRWGPQWAYAVAAVVIIALAAWLGWYRYAGSPEVSEQPRIVKEMPPAAPKAVIEVLEEKVPVAAPVAV